MRASTKARIIYFPLIVVVTIFVSLYLYKTYNQKTIQLERLADCELIEIAKALDSFYSSNNYYPDRKNWVANVRQSIDNEICGRSINILDNAIVDPWGNPYCYLHINNNKVRIYASHAYKVNIDKYSMKDRFIVYELEKMKPSRLELSEIDLC